MTIRIPAEIQCTYTTTTTTGWISLLSLWVPSIVWCWTYCNPKYHVIWYIIVSWIQIHGMIIPSLKLTIELFNALNQTSFNKMWSSAFSNFEKVKLQVNDAISKELSKYFEKKIKKNVPSSTPETCYNLVLLVLLVLLLIGHSNKDDPWTQLHSPILRTCLEFISWISIHLTITIENKSTKMFHHCGSRRSRNTHTRFQKRLTKTTQTFHYWLYIW